MTETQHTPAPWNAIEQDGGDFMIENNESIVAAVGGFGDGAAPHVEANARLIAAAPEMFEALKLAAFMAECLWHLQGNDEARKVAEFARAALAKAQGSERQFATNRPGDEAAIMHEETGIDYQRCLVMCNMD